MGGFSASSRRGGLERAAEGVADLLVVGAGITGSGVAREAALRGLATVLLDKGDIGGGTSSRSSKLIHGGLRYLAQGEVGLVREAARERSVLRRIAPHLAKPVPVLIPAGSKAGRMRLGAGLWTFVKLAPAGSGESYRSLDAAETYQAEPLLKKGRLAGSVAMTEYITSDARLTLETARSAAVAGAVVANYAEVVGVEEDSSGFRVTVEDRSGGGRLVIRCRVLVNAAGPWFDRVRALLDDGRQAAAKGMVQLTRGIHLVVPHQRLPLGHMVILRAGDGRSTFAIPRPPYTYIGTTDTAYDGAPEEPGVSTEDTAYLLDSVSRAFEDAPSVADVVGTWSGVRPLLRQEGRPPHEISRRDEIVCGPGPVVSVAGGKLTTYRCMAVRVIEKVFELLHRSPDVDIDSATVPLVGGSLAEQQAVRVKAPALADEDLANRLWSTYGTEALGIVERISSEPASGEPVGGLSELTLAEVEHAVESEMVITLDDLLRRRSSVAMFDGGRAAAAAVAVATCVGRLCGWPAERVQAEADTVSQRAIGELATVKSVQSTGGGG